MHYWEDEKSVFELNKIECIKFVRKIASIGLVEAKIIVEKYFELANIDKIDDNANFNRLTSMALLARDEKILVVKNQDGNFKVIYHKEFDFTDYKNL
jgi:hypothetical protein